MFSPNATPEQIRACFEWLKVAESYEPALTEKEMESYLENRREQLQTQRDQGLIVYTASTDVWNIPELTTKTKELAHQLANIDMRMVETSFDTSMVNIKPEEPMNCQDLYSILDSCIQEVLLNQDADPAALIKQANSDFQKNYLDKAE